MYFFFDISDIGIAFRIVYSILQNDFFYAHNPCFSSEAIPGIVPKIKISVCESTYG
jgi:hypothetical protein